MILVSIVLLFQLPCDAQLKQTRRVLILNDLGIISSPGFAEVDQAVFSVLEKSPYQIELYHESLEITLFPDQASQRRFRDQFVQKYSERRPDVIIAVGSASFRFVAESQEKFLRETPLIFCAFLGDVPGDQNPGRTFTGVVGKPHPASTLNLALRLLPGTKHIVVVGGMGQFDRGFEEVARDAFHDYESKLEFTYLTDLSMPALLERLKHLPPNSIVYHTAITKDAAGELYVDSAQSVPLVAAAANAPVFVMDDVDLRGGSIGGDLVNWADDGRAAAQMAVRVLDGEAPSQIPVTTSEDAFMFDWPALQRWGINPRALPAGSVVINRPPTFWELYREYVLIGVFVLLAQTLAILGLLWQRSRRRQTEDELRRSEEKFSKSFRHGPLAITIASAKDGRYIDVNETFTLHTGWSSHEVIGRNPIELGLWTDPSQRAAFISRLLAQGSLRDVEITLRRKDGQIRTAFGSAELIEVQGEPCALSVFADITDRKQAEEAIASLSGRLIEAQEDERKRIARELHDDYNQRLALLSNDLVKLARNGSSASVEITKRLYELSDCLSKLGEDLHSLSHRLHSSTLETLGLVAGVGAFCEEFSEQQGIRVRFTHSHVPRSIPADAALCLFRVMQEALRNVKRHSGATRAEVHLEQLDEGLHLSVRDQGNGFDSNQTASARGIGIRSMEERLRLQGGRLEIHSQPTEGTTVDAWLPLKIASAA